MLIKNNICIKDYYRFIEFSLLLMGKELSHERCKTLVLDEYKCESKEEIFTKRYANAFLYILNNNKQIISRDLLNDTYYLLTKETLPLEINNKIIELIYKDYDDSPHFIAANIHIKVLNLDIKEKEKYAFLLLNLILLKKERNIVIIYKDTFETYKDIIEKKDVYRLMFLVMQCEQKNKAYELNETPSLERIMIVIKNLKNKLVNIYKIEKLYLYGSLAKNKINEQSDIDFIIKYKENYLNYEKNIKYPNLLDVLKKELNYKKIDLLDFTHAITNMEIGEMENIITLI